MLYSTQCEIEKCESQIASKNRKKLRHFNFFQFIVNTCPLRHSPLKKVTACHFPILTFGGISIKEPCISAMLMFFWRERGAWPHCLWLLQEMSSFLRQQPRSRAIGHFQISLNLFLKTSLGVHPFIWKWDFIHMQILTHFHMNGCAPSLAFMKRLRWTRKWAIVALKVSCLFWNQST